MYGERVTYVSDITSLIHSHSLFDSIYCYLFLLLLVGIVVAVAAFFLVVRLSCSCLVFTYYYVQGIQVENVVNDTTTIILYSVCVFAFGISR